MAEVDVEVLERALAYPYDRPAGAFRYWPAEDRVEMFASLDPDDLGARTVVLAIGSNAAPVQLRHKFGEHPAGEGPIVVLPARVRDHDVVHGALVARYGSVPATLAGSPATICHVQVTLLDAAQLERMHETEGLGHAYELANIEPSLVDVDLLGRPDAVEAYVAAPGPMLVEGVPVALSAVAARGRTLPAWHQHEVLAHLAGLSGLTLEQLVLGVTTDDDARRQAAELLRAR